MEKREPSCTVGRNLNGYSHYGEQYGDFVKTGNKTTIWPIPLLGMYPEKTTILNSWVGIPGLGRSAGEGIGYLLQYSWASLVAQQRIRLQCGRPGFNSWVGKIHWKRDRLHTPVFLGFPYGSAGKESTCNEGDLGLIPGLGRSPGERKEYPVWYSGLENSMDCIVYGVAESQTLLSNFHFLLFQNICREPFLLKLYCIYCIYLIFHWASPTFWKTKKPVRGMICSQQKIRDLFVFLKVQKLEKIYRGK